jgi:hypothetical protein
MSLRILALILGVSALCQFSIAGAEQITFVFDGTASGVLGAQNFSNADLSVTAVEDTAEVPGPTAPFGIISFTPDLVTIDISTVGTTTVPNAYVFDTQSSGAAGFGVTSGSDSIQIYDPSLATYDMKSPIGPIFEAADPSVSDWTDMPTSMGDLTVNSYTNLTFTATLGGGGNGNVVPAPSAGWLSLIGLPIVVIAARRGLSAGRKA